MHRSNEDRISKYVEKGVDGESSPMNPPDAFEPPPDPEAAAAKPAAPATAGAQASVYSVRVNGKSYTVEVAEGGLARLADGHDGPLDQFISERLDFVGDPPQERRPLGRIDGLPVDRDLAQRLRNMSRAMDPVKYAGETLEEKQMEADLFFAREFVRKTTPSLDAAGNDSSNKINVEVNGQKSLNVKHRASNIEH